MECPTCLEIYLEKVRQPRSLPCGHTFCDVCLSKIFDDQRRLCPTCRNMCQLTQVTELPINFVAAELARQYHERQMKYLSCSVHPLEVLRFFCNTCNDGLCAECIITHSGHFFVKYDESVQVLRNKASELMGNMETGLSQLNTLKAEVETSAKMLSEKTEAEMRKIETEFEGLKSCLEFRKQSLKAQYMRYVNAEGEKIQRESRKLNEKEAAYLREQAELTIRTSHLDTMTDSDIATKGFSSVLAESQERIRSLEAHMQTEVSFQCSMPEFLFRAKQYREQIESMGAIINDSSEDFDIVQPMLCFFGDKNQIMTFDISTQQWDLRNLFSQHEFNYYAAAVTLPDGSALITGGGSSNMVLHYKDRKIVTKSNMNQVRKEHAAVYLGGYVFVMGGYDGQTGRFLKEGEKFSTIGDEWTPIASMNVARCAFSATTVNSRSIYIFGGYDGTQRLQSIEKYDPEEDRWMLLPVSLKYALSNSACFSPRKNHVIVLGGGLSSGFSLAVQLLDTETGLWTNLPMMTEGRDLRNKVVFFANFVYCVGGYNFKAEAFALDRSAWVQLPNYLVSDNMDSWSCALMFKRCEKKAASQMFYS